MLGLTNSFKKNQVTGKIFGQFYFERRKRRRIKFIFTYKFEWLKYKIFERRHLQCQVICHSWATYKHS